MKSNYDYFFKKINFNTVSDFINDINKSFNDHFESEINKYESKQSVNFYIMLWLIICIILKSIGLITYALLINNIFNIKLLFIIITCLIIIIFCITCLLRLKYIINKEKKIFFISLEQKNKLTPVFKKWNNYFKKFKIHVEFPLGFNYIILSFENKIKFDNIKHN